jgi:putative ABC transport system permease protein
VKVGDPAQIESAREELRGLLRKIRKVPPGQDDDFAINQQEQLLAQFKKVSGVIATAGFFITGLSLFVGGIGIMNIMFVSVAERTHEIGIRKAIGAKRRTILLQFLIEAASICLIGAVIALVIARGMVEVARHYLPQVALSPSVVLLALIVAIVTGLVSGFLPAWRAARMSPVDALRNEWTATLPLRFTGGGAGRGGRWRCRAAAGRSSARACWPSAAAPRHHR